MPTKETPEQEAPAADPYDLEALRVSGLGDIDVDRPLLTVPVRRPGKAEFFRVHKEPGYSTDTAIVERENNMDREVYLIAPGVRGALSADLTLVRLFTCMSKRGSLFLWAAKLPAEDNAGRRWRESALEIAELAKSNWVKMRGDRDGGFYEALVARGELGEPAWPVESFQQMIRIAFKGPRLIDSVDHDVIRELNGEL